MRTLICSGEELCKVILWCNILYYNALCSLHCTLICSGEELMLTTAKIYCTILWCTEHTYTALQSCTVMQYISEDWFAQEKNSCLPLQSTKLYCGSFTFKVLLQCTVHDYSAHCKIILNCTILYCTGHHYTALQCNLRQSTAPTALHCKVMLHCIKFCCTALYWKVVFGFLDVFLILQYSAVQCNAV